MSRYGATTGSARATPVADSHHARNLRSPVGTIAAWHTPDALQSKALSLAPKYLP